MLFCNIYNELYRLQYLRSARQVTIMHIAGVNQAHEPRQGVD